MKFKEFLKENIFGDVDASQIETIYDKAKIAVALVKKYKPELLKNISVIANLPSGAYGVYTHFKLKGQSKNPSGIVYKNKENNVPLNQLPKQVIAQHFPNINPSKLEKGDVIKVNIQGVLNNPNIKTDFETVKQIAGIIVHECVHKEEVDKTGQTSETNPERIQREFLQFLDKPEVAKEIAQELLKYPASSKSVGKLF